MNFDYWQGRLSEALDKAREAESARTCMAYLELAAHYRALADLAHRHGADGRDASEGSITTIQRGIDQPGRPGQSSIAI